MQIGLTRVPGLGALSSSGQGRRVRRHGAVGPFHALLIAVLAVAAGVASAWWAIENWAGFERVRVGVWSAWPTAGQEGGDPYLRARLARSGELPLSIAEGVSLTAAEDSAGSSLQADCDYRVHGRMPAAQWWTLTVYRASDRKLMDTKAGRSSFRSDQVVRTADDNLDIALSSQARPGNWLPVDPDAGEVMLVLRLYDTPLATGGKLVEAEVPAVERLTCR